MLAAQSHERGRDSPSTVMPAAATAGRGRERFRGSLHRLVEGTSANDGVDHRTSAGTASHADTQSRARRTVDSPDGMQWMLSARWIVWTIASPETSPRPARPPLRQELKRALRGRKSARPRPTSAETTRPGDAWKVVALAIICVPTRMSISRREAGEEREGPLPARNPIHTTIRVRKFLSELLLDFLVPKPARSRYGAATCGRLRDHHGVVAVVALGAPIRRARWTVSEIVQLDSRSCPALAAEHGRRIAAAIEKTSTCSCRARRSSIAAARSRLMITSVPGRRIPPHVDEPDGGHGPIEDAPVERACAYFRRPRSDRSHGRVAHPATQARS
jgi:hypothetical protein